MTTRLASAARIEDRPVFPDWNPVAPDHDPALGDAPLDDRTVAYVLAARPVYDGLRRAAAQMAGLLVLAAIGGKSGQDHPMVALAEAAHKEASERLGGLRPTPRAAHHHRHLGLASESLAQALAAARAGLHRAAREPGATERFVSETIDHLRWSGGALPGFEIVDFTQGCACHHGLHLTSNQDQARIGAPGRSSNHG